jgi:hypothetical protein
LAWLIFGKNKYIWRLKKKPVKIKKYITKHLVVRFCLLLTLVSAAAVFDMYHSGNNKLAGQSHNIPSPDQSENNKVFFYNQVPSNNVKTSGSDFVVRFRFACTQNKFLLKYYNLRTFQMMKAEAVSASFTSENSFHSVPYNKEIYDSPDDTPPLI